MAKKDLKKVEGQVINFDTWSYKDARIYRKDDNENMTLDFSDLDAIPMETLHVTIAKRQPKDFPRTINLDRRYKGTKEFLKRTSNKK